MPALVLSFIGDTDFRLMNLPRPGARQKEPAPDEVAPLVRMLNELLDRNLFTRDDRLLIFDDWTRKGDGRVAPFCEAVSGHLAAMLNLPSVDLKVHEIQTRSPTNLDDLYREVFAAIPKDAAVFVNLSSGTPAMHTTLVLAGSCLPLASARFFESSTSDGVSEVRLPYMVAAKSRIEVDRAPNRSSRLEATQSGPLAGLKLLPHTVTSDAAVAATLAAACKARLTVEPVLIAGVQGSGKTWIAKAAAFNAGRATVVVDAQTNNQLHIDCSEARGAPVNIILTHLDAASDEFLAQAAALVNNPSGAVVTTTLRTDRVPLAGDRKRFGEFRRRLAAGGEFHMPAPHSRTDYVELAEEMMIEAGQWRGKIKERLQYELATARFPDGLHSVKRWINTAAALSPGRNTDARALKASGKQIQATDAAAILQNAAAALAGGGAAVPAPDLIAVVEHATMLIAEASNLTQTEIANQLGYSSRATYKNRRDKSEAAYEKFAASLDAPGQAIDEGP